MKQNTPAKKAWSPRQIRAQLILRAMLPKDVGANVGLSQQAITATIRGDREGVKPRQAIADALGVPVTDIWPDALLPFRERRRLRCAS